MKKSERIGPYTLLRQLGEGPSCRMWLANAGLNDHKVALKLAREEDQVGRVGIMHEIDIAADFDHPNIVRIHECGAAKGCTWITMGYLPGPQRQLTLANFRQLLLALNHVHSNDVVHADIKNANLLLDENGDVRLADFSLARRAGQAGVRGSGSPACMSPEQLRGEPLDARADLFAAGVVLYQILTGSAPFEAATPDAMPQLITDSQPAPSAMAPGLGASFDEVCMRALARERGQRFQNAFEFLAAFDTACQRGVRPLAA